MLHNWVSDKFLQAGDLWLTLILLALAGVLIYIALVNKSTLVKAVVAAWVILP